MLSIVNDNETHNINCAILVLNFSAVGYIAPNAYDQMPVVLPFKVSSENNAKFLESNAIYNDRECNKDNFLLSERRSGTIQCKQHSTCSGECCSVNGMLFVGCVTKYFPIDNIKMEDIMYDCDYSKHMNPESMSNFDKALIVQWWFCANVYIMTEKFIFKQLPCCLISEIERVYPYDDAVVCKMAKSLTNVTNAPKRLAD